MKLYKKYLQEALMGDEKKVRRVLDVAAGVIVKKGENDEDLLLLIQRASNDHWPLHWEFPRGKCDKPVGEDLLHCCKREIKEEVGLDVIPLFEIDTFEYIADHGTRKSICHNFLCKLKDPDQPIKLSKEHESYQWVQSLGEVEMLVFPDQKKTIEKVFNKDIQIVSYPENAFTKNNAVEEYLQYIQGESVGSVFAAAVGIPVIIAWAHQVYKNTMTKAHRACRGLKSSELSKCLTNYRYQAIKGEIKALKDAKKFCKKT
ncbi:MAG: NUDIX domain-containing protein, partial [Candidatus Thorarchaeota archaeon]